MKRKPSEEKPSVFEFDVYAFEDLIGLGLTFIIVPGVTDGSFRIFNLAFIRELVIDHLGLVSFQYQQEIQKETFPDNLPRFISLTEIQSAAFVERIANIQESIKSFTGKIFPQKGAL